MPRPLLFASLFVGLGCAAAPCLAQMSQPPLTSALPNVGSMTAGNAAGVLQYCMKNKLVSSTSAGVVLDGLGKKPDMTSSADYAAGQAGKVLTGDGKSTSISSLQPAMKSQACNMVLKQAKSFL